MLLNVRNNFKIIYCFQKSIKTTQKVPAVDIPAPAVGEVRSLYVSSQ